MPKDIRTAGQLHAAVAAADRPVVVDFWAAWCGPCKTMEPVLEQLETYRFADVLKVNVDETDVGAAYGIQSIPTMLVFHQGTHVDTIVGAVPLQTLVARLPKPDAAAT